MTRALVIAFALVFLVAYLAGGCAVWWRVVRPLRHSHQAIKNALACELDARLAAQDARRACESLAERAVAERDRYAAHGVQSMTVEQLLDEAGVR